MALVNTPRGPLPAEEVLSLFQQVGFEPPAGMPLQQAFDRMLQLLQQQARQQRQLPSFPARGRTAVRPAPADVPAVLARCGAVMRPLEPCGLEISGVDTTKRLAPELAGALELLMAEQGFVLFRGQGSVQEESGVRGKFLTGRQQCELSVAFGAGELCSTHGNHEECPNRDVFRLSNDASRGFNEVGPEWHNDGSFLREVFSHVVYHIVKAPEGPGDTAFAHLGKALDLLPPERQARLARCASVNSNGGVVHPLVHAHPVSGRRSLYLHLGMTGAVIERTDGALRAFNHAEMEELFKEVDEVLNRVSVSHKWREGDVVVIDNLAVAHKAAPGAHVASSGLRILHRTTCKGTAPLDPEPSLRLPLTMDTKGPCPFDDAVWVEGYVGFRWGDWQSRSVPH